MNHEHDYDAHRTKALGSLDAVRAIGLELDDAHADRTRSNAGAIARASREHQTTMRAAEVHALIYVGDVLDELLDAVRDLGKPGPPRPQVVLR